MQSPKLDGALLLLRRVSVDECRMGASVHHDPQKNQKQVFNEIKKGPP